MTHTRLGYLVSVHSLTTAVLYALIFYVIMSDINIVSYILFMSSATVTPLGIKKIVFLAIFIIL
jgi:hypothetical protein